MHIVVSGFYGTVSLRRSRITHANAEHKMSCTNTKDYCRHTVEKNSLVTWPKISWGVLDMGAFAILALQNRIDGYELNLLTPSFTDIEQSPISCSERRLPITLRSKRKPNHKVMRLLTEHAKCDSLNAQPRELHPASQQPKASARHQHHGCSAACTPLQRACRGDVYTTARVCGTHGPGEPVPRGRCSCLLAL